AAIKREAPYINGDGETSRDFTFVENAVQANIKAMLYAQIEKHEVINIAYGQRTTLNELWKKIQYLAGVQVDAKYREERKGDVKHSLADISKANSLLNYHPSKSIGSGLEITLKWYENHFS